VPPPPAEWSFFSSYHPTYIFLSIFFAKSLKFASMFLETSPNTQTYGNYLGFPAIPAKNREFYHAKRQMLVEISTRFCNNPEENSPKICEMI
jgi:hypothetical protein